MPLKVWSMLKHSLELPLNGTPRGAEFDGIKILDREVSHLAEWMYVSTLGGSVYVFTFYENLAICSVLSLISLKGIRTFNAARLKR